MEVRLKQRAIGAIVLTALAIIFLPMLLEGSAEERARLTAVIPEPPRIDLKVVTIQDITARMEAMAQESAAGVPGAIDYVEVAEEEVTDFLPPADGKAEPSFDQNNLPVSWSLKLGSFKSQENALNLRTTLRGADFKTYIIRGTTEEGPIFRVYVGPMLDRGRLAVIGREIETKFDLKGRIVRYRIEDDAGQLGG